MGWKENVYIGIDIWNALLFFFECFTVCIWECVFIHAAYVM